MNRFEDNQINNETNNPDVMMTEIKNLLSDTVAPIPDVGMLCTFEYNAKTPNISFDQYPLVAVTGIFPWGFRGLNFHWGESRQYTWGEMVSQVYIVQQNELDDLLAIPYAKIITK